jgi:hypothetical protein
MTLHAVWSWSWRLVEFVVVGIGVKKFENFKILGRKRVLEKSETLYTDKKVLSSKMKTVK